ncbi:MAG: hypothetical protein PHN60_01930 [Candidatus Gracilibacteria bacterium]|nr:hypothetical protein [Candidatus Gracilibacteria bacterium]
MNIHNVKNSIYSALIFFGTLIVLSVGYGLVGNLSIADKVESGSGLTATSWNRIIDGVLDLNTRLSNLSFSGGNVGIGTTNPNTNLEISGGDTGISIHGTNRGRINIFTPNQSGWQIEVADVAGNQPAGYLGFTESGVSGGRLILAKGGNVGIGTVNPSQRLDLGGGAIGDGNIGGGIKIGGGGIGSSGSCILSAYSDQTSCPALWTKLAPGLCAKCQ